MLKALWCVVVCVLVLSAFGQHLKQQKQSSCSCAYWNAKQLQSLHQDQAEQQPQQLQQPKQTNQEHEQGPSEDSKVHHKTNVLVQPLAAPGRDFFIRRLQERLHSGHKPFDIYRVLMQAANEQFSQDAPKKFLIFTCSEHMPCGGLGDRINGIISTFYLALLTNRVLIVDWHKDISWEHYVRPNQVDWRPSSHLNIASLSSVTLHCIDYCNDYDDLFSRGDVSNFLGKFDVVRITTNMMMVDLFMQNPYFDEISKFYNLPQLDEQGLIFQAAFTFLVRPTELVEAVLQKLGDNVLDCGINPDTLQYIGVHVRTGGDGKWADPSRVSRDKVPTFAKAALDLSTLQIDVSSNTASSRATNESSCMNTSFGDHFESASNKKISKNHAFFITSDSSLSLQALANEFCTFEQVVLSLDHIAGDITHLERSADAKDVYKSLRTFADWFVLMTMDRLVISRSGFSETASAATCVPLIYFGAPYSYILANASFFPSHGFCTPYKCQRQRSLGQPS